MAETRLRAVVDDDARVDEGGLRACGVDGVVRLPDRVVHLIVGPNADQYAAEMHAQPAGAYQLSPEGRPQPQPAGA